MEKSLKLSTILFILVTSAGEIYSSVTPGLQNVTNVAKSIDEWLFSEDLFPGHEIPQNIQHPDALKMFSTLLEDKNIFTKAYEKYRTQHNKELDDDVKQEARKSHFKEHLHTIFHHNLKADAGHFRFQLGVNTFADMSIEEMRNFLGANDKLPVNHKTSGEDSTNKNPNKPPLPPTTNASTFPFPPSYDLRDGKLISPVKNQKRCGSCVFFSMAGLVEALHAIKTDGEIIDVSEQMMLDCATPKNGYLDNAGCSGNTMEDTLRFLVDHGVTTESSYKYIAKQQDCTMNGKKIVAQLKDWWNIEDSVDAFKDTLLNKRAPIAAAFLVYPTFMFYRAGIFDYCAPPASYIGGHAVLITGFGQFFDQGYWIVKNSWGTKWGENGYFKYISGSRFCKMERWGFTGTLV